MGEALNGNEAQADASPENLQTAKFFDLCRASETLAVDGYEIDDNNWRVVSAGIATRLRLSCGDDENWYIENQDCQFTADATSVQVMAKRAMTDAALVQVEVSFYATRSVPVLELIEAGSVAP